MIGRDEVGILIVDPSETYQRILTSILRKLGFTRVFKATNPLKGQVMLEHDKTINVVFCELMMPEPGNGLGFVAQIRRKLSAEQLPVLMMTNLAEREYVQQAIRLGVNGYLIKPIDPEHLEAHMWRLFDLPLRGPQKLGEYLVESGVITGEQRDLALEIQKIYSSDNVNLSVIALYMGYLSVRDLERVFMSQEDDEAFLERAGALGMSPEQVGYLRQIKQEYRLRLGDILVKIGMVEKADLERALEGFRMRAQTRATRQPTAADEGSG